MRASPNTGLLREFLVVFDHADGTYMSHGGVEKDKLEDFVAAAKENEASLVWRIDKDGDPMLEITYPNPPARVAKVWAMMTG